MFSTESGWHDPTIDVGEKDWKRKWASENIRASLSCLLFLPQMRKTHCISGERRGKETQSAVHWYMVIERRMCRASGTDYTRLYVFHLLDTCFTVDIKSSEDA